MRIIAFITAATVVRELLRALGAPITPPTSAPRGRRVFGARSPLDRHHQARTTRLGGLIYYPPL